MDVYFYNTQTFTVKRKKNLASAITEITDELQKTTMEERNANVVNVEPVHLLKIGFRHFLIMSKVSYKTVVSELLH